VQPPELVSEDAQQPACLAGAGWPAQDLNPSFHGNGAFPWTVSITLGRLQQSPRSASTNGSAQSRFLEIIRKITELAENTGAT